jgi:hypothetical protein
VAPAAGEAAPGNSGSGLENCRFLVLMRSFAGKAEAEEVWISQARQAKIVLYLEYESSRGSIGLRAV